MKPLQADGSIIWVESAESTNSELRRLMDGLDNLSVIAARRQTAGRGQGDHSWYSSPATNLTFSMLFRFGEGFPVRLASSDAVFVTRISALAIRDHLLSRGIESRIKWPNDIWTGDRKICGMLIENSSIGGEISSSIAGIGLNVNETRWPEELPNPVSMSEISGKRYELERELEDVAACLRRRYFEAASPEGRRKLEEEFERFVFRLPSKS